MCGRRSNFSKSASGYWFPAEASRLFPFGKNLAHIRQPRFGYGYLTKCTVCSYGGHVPPLACGEPSRYGKNGWAWSRDATAYCFRKTRTPQLARAACSCRRLLTNGELGDPLWLAIRTLVPHRKDRSDAGAARCETATPGQECGQLDASGGLLWRLAGPCCSSALRTGCASGGKSAF